VTSAVDSHPPAVGNLGEHTPDASSSPRKQQPVAKSGGDVATQASASTCGTDEPGAQSLGDASSVKCGSDPSDAGDHAAGSNGGISSAPKTRAETASCNTGPVANVLSNAASAQLSCATRTMEHPSHHSPVLRAVAGQWYHTIASEVVVCVVEPDGRAHYNGVHLGSQYDLFEHECARGIVGIRRGDGWVVDMEESKVGLLVWKKKDEDDVSWYRVASSAGVVVNIPSTVPGRQQMPESSSVNWPVGKVGHPESGKAEVASRSEGASAHELIDAARERLLSDREMARNVKAESPVRVERSDCGQTSPGGSVVPSPALQAIAGRWQVALAGEVTMCVIRADGRADYNGIHLGSQYNLVEYECASGAAGIRRGDGWIMDMEESKVGLLVWKKEGEPDVAWLRVPPQVGAIAGFPSADGASSGEIKVRAGNGCEVVRPAGLFSCSPCVQKQTS